MEGQRWWWWYVDDTVAINRHNDDKSKWVKYEALMRVRVHDPKIWSRANQGLSYTASGAEAPVFPPKLTRVGVFSITFWCRIWLLTSPFQYIPHPLDCGWPLNHWKRTECKGLWGTRWHRLDFNGWSSRLEWLWLSDYLTHSYPTWSD